MASMPKVHAIMLDGEDRARAALIMVKALEDYQMGSDPQITLRVEPRKTEASTVLWMLTKMRKRLSLTTPSAAELQEVEFSALGTRCAPHKHAMPITTMLAIMTLPLL